MPAHCSTAVVDMVEESIDTELLGRSAFRKLEHGFAIRDRLVDVLAEQQAIERQYRRRGDFRPNGEKSSPMWRAP